MINILYLHLGAELYGADVILLELIKNIDKTKYRPYVLLPEDGPLVKELQSLGVEVHIMDFPIMRRKYFNVKGIFRYGWEFIKSQKELMKFCRDKNIDIIHSNTAAVLEGALIWKKLKAKHIWHLHEMLDRPRILYTVLARIISRNCDRVLTVSNSVKNHWLKSGRFKEEQITVIHNGIDIDRFRPDNNCDYLREEFGISTDEKVVGLIGRINAIKGQEVFVRAMELVMDKNPKVKALIVGGVYEGQEWRLKKLKKMISSSKHNDKFIISDFRTDSENIHCLLDLFVLSSIMYDSFPTVVLEAMASKKPIAAFESGGVVEMVEDGVNGYYAKFGDAVDLSRKIEEILNDDELRKRMGEKGYELVHSKFTSKCFSKNVQEFYLEILNRG